MPNKIKTRIAPSPTGPLHIGTARTALFNFLFVKQSKGKFVLRIEDTDLERSDPRFENNIKKSLEWLGLEWDEFYRQSERSDIYEKYLKKLLTEEKIFWCLHSEKELSQERNKQIKEKMAPKHICSYRDKNPKIQEIKDKQGILRFKNNFDKDIKFSDLIRKETVFKSSLLGDFSVAKNTKTPLYNFAVVVDDQETNITHVIRGEDHISNTPRQILISEALGFKLPVFAHLPLILGKDRSKLSKRHGAISVMEYERQGYLAEALINFMALLGWNPGDDREIFSLKELIKGFSLMKVQKGGAIFDIEKLNWVNKEHIKRLTTKNLAKKLLPFLKEDWQKLVMDEKEYWINIVRLEQQRLNKLSDIKEGADFFFEIPCFSKDLLLWKGSQEINSIIKHLDKLYNILSNLENKNFNQQRLEKEIMPYAENAGRGEVLWPFRVALSGKSASPGPFEIAAILGKEKTLQRIQKARQMLF